jgi:hypothetical protein
MNFMDLSPDYTPRSGKIEWHITYRCNLGCRACSRCSWMEQPHTPDMTLDDARECMRQADEIGWRRLPGPGYGAEPPRIVIVGGEPTLHPQFLEFVRMAMEWSGTYCEVFSNHFTAESRELLDMARTKFGASINRDGIKTAPRRSPDDGGQVWGMETYVSPHEAGLPLKICYCHSFMICGIGYDSSGFSPCPLGMMVSKILGVKGTTRNLADLFNAETMYFMTTEICRHCGYEGQNRYAPSQLLGAFRDYAATCPKLKSGDMVSPIWQKAFEKLGVK